MHLLDLPHELLSYIVHIADPDSLRALCLTEKHALYRIAHHFLWRNITVMLGTGQNPKPNLFSFNSRRLAAIRSLSVIVDGYFNVGLSSFALVLASMININHVRVSGGSAPFIRLILENTTATLVTLELVHCDAEPQDFVDMDPSMSGIRTSMGQGCLSVSDLAIPIFVKAEGYVSLVRAEMQHVAKPCNLPAL